jgi:hypothetical protein
MTIAHTGTLVLKDGAGNYFLVSQETLERGRVPEEHKAEMEEAIVAAQGGAGGDDVQGHLFFVVAAACIFGVGFNIGYDVAEAAVEKGELKGLTRR